MTREDGTSGVPTLRTLQLASLLSYRREVRSQDWSCASMYREPL